MDLKQSFIYTGKALGEAEYVTKGQYNTENFVNQNSKKLFWRNPTFEIGENALEETL